VGVLVASTELLKSDSHAVMHGRLWTLDYPGRDTAQSHGGATISEVLGPDVTEYARRAFHRFVSEHGFDLSFTGKGHPGRKVLFAPGGNTELAQLWVWPDFGCQARAPREMYSGVANAQAFVNDRGTAPKVVSSLGAPDFLSGRIKFVNAAFMSFDEIVAPDPDGKPLNVDQVLGTGWSHVDGMFDAFMDESIVIPFSGESAEEIQEKFGSPYVTLVSTPSGSGVELTWRIIRRKVGKSSRGWKALNPDAVKGMVIPESVLLCERRPGEDFVRPLHLAFASEAVIKKEASRSILRMLASRINGSTNTQVFETSPREDFPRVLAEVRKTLALQGDDGMSEIFRLVPGRMSVRVLGFQGSVDHLEAIPEDSVGTVLGALSPVTGEDGRPLRVVTGEVPIMRMPENEDFGNFMRTDEQGIRLDPFMVLGKDGAAFPENQKARELLDFEAELVRALDTIDLSE
jgi:hypothetical protein